MEELAKLHPVSQVTLPIVICIGILGLCYIGYLFAKID